MVESRWVPFPPVPSVRIGVLLFTRCSRSEGRVLLCTVVVKLGGKGEDLVGFACHAVAFCPRIIYSSCCIYTYFAKLFIARRGTPKGLRILTESVINCLKVAMKRPFRM